MPTPPTDTYYQANAPLPEVDTKPTAARLESAGSYALLAEDIPSKTPLNAENDIKLRAMDDKTHGNKNDFPKKVESVV